MLFILKKIKTQIFLLACEKRGYEPRRESVNLVFDHMFSQDNLTTCAHIF